jgi:hypothetical protein
MDDSITNNQQKNQTCTSPLVASCLVVPGVALCAVREVPGLDGVNGLC